VGPKRVYVLDLLLIFFRAYIGNYLYRYIVELDPLSLRSNCVLRRLPHVKIGGEYEVYAIANRRHGAGLPLWRLGKDEQLPRCHTWPRNSINSLTYWTVVQVKEDDKGGICSTHGENRNCIHKFWSKKFQKKM
jgi:hypothetical protein